jgi:hypothetical protein
MTRTVVSGSSGGGGGGGGGASPSTGNFASGTFGTGLIRIHGSSRGTYSFTVPSGISSVRVRVWGAGGGGSSTASSAGGSGGGFAIGEFAVSAGETYPITVGAGGGLATAGGTSSFGSLISATGGEGRNATSFRDGGLGVGGYANYYGGGTGGSYCGGGGAGSLFGHGSPGIANLAANNTASYGPLSGGGGGGLGTSGSVSSSQVTGPIGGLSGGWFKFADYDGSSANSIRTVTNLMSLDMLATGVGGASESRYLAFGTNGSGGGYGGSGGWPGGGGGHGGNGQWGQGADGCVIVEY